MSDLDPHAKRDTARVLLVVRRLILILFHPAPEDERLSESVRRGLLSIANGIGKRYGAGDGR